MLDSSFSRILDLVYPEKKFRTRQGYLADFFVIAAVVFLVDVFVGAMGGLSPIFKWIFLALNIPFGTIYVWMESSYIGDATYMLGLKIGEIASMFIFLFIVLAQSLVYLGVYERMKKNRGRREPRAA